MRNKKAALIGMILPILSALVCACAIRLEDTYVTPRPTEKTDPQYETFAPQELSREALSDADRKFYDEIFAKIQGLEDFSYEAHVGYDKLDALLYIWGEIRQDHPEIDDYFTVAEVMDESGKNTLALKSRYYLAYAAEREATREEVQKLRSDVGAKADAIIESMAKGLSTADKYRFLAVQLSQSTQYDNSSVVGMAAACPYGGLLGGQAVCQGYAEAYQYLCNRAGLWCRVVEGSAGDTSHAWNLIRISDGTYHVDVTWADEAGDAASAAWERYFCLTQEEILTDHAISDGTNSTGAVYGYTARTGEALSKAPEGGKSDSPAALSGKSFVSPDGLWSLTFPADMTGDILWLEKEDGEVCFYEKNNRDAGYEALLFRIVETDWQTCQSGVFFEPIVLHTSDDLTVICETPGNAPYNEEVPELRGKYMNIASRLQEILDTFITLGA